jgi:hypothetical protein
VIARGAEKAGKSPASANPAITVQTKHQPVLFFIMRLL